MAKSFFEKFANEFEGLEKGDLDNLVETGSYHFDKVRFIRGDKGEYAQFTIQEVEGFFFNASNPVSEVLIEIRDAGEIENLADVAWKFRKGISKQWNTEYIAMSAVL